LRWQINALKMLCRGWTNRWQKGIGKMDLGKCLLTTKMQCIDITCD